MNISIKNILFQINEILRYPIIKVQNSDISLWSFLIFLLIIYLSTVLAKKLSEFLSTNFLNKDHFDLGKRDAISKIVSYLVYISGIIIALQTIGIDLSVLLAGGAILAVGIGFGIQNLVTNFIW